MSNKNENQHEYIGIHSKRLNGEFSYNVKPYVLR
jgi:hypothetical protein